MKFIIGLLLISIGAFAAMTEVERAELPYRSIDPNSGFEHGKQGITASAGTVSVVTSGDNLLRGKASLTWYSTANGQTLKGSTVTVPGSLRGTNGVARCFVKSPSSTSAHYLDVIHSSGTTINTVSVNSSTAGFASSNNFVFPDSGAVQWQLRSNEVGLTALDDCYLGAADNVFSSNQAELFGTSKTVGAASCTMNQTSATFADFAVDADCNNPTVTGKLETPTNKRVSLKANFPPGKYQIVLSNPHANFASGAYSTCKWDFGGVSSTEHNILDRDTSTSDYESSMNFSLDLTAPFSGDATLQCKVSTATLSLVLGSADASLNISVYRFPSQGETAYRADQVNFPWTSGGTMVISATTTAPAKGTTSIDRVMYRREGDTMHVRFEYTQSGTGTAGSGDYLFRIPGGYSIDTTKVTAYATLEGSGAWTAKNIVGSADIGGGSSNIVGNVSVYDSYHVRIHALNASGGGVIGSGFFGTNSSDYHITAQFAVPILTWTAASAPQLVNSVLSGYSGVTKIETARLDGDCVVSEESYDWIASTVDNSTGDCTVNINSGVFSSTPKCQVEGEATNAAVNGVQTKISTTTTPSATVIRYTTANTAGTYADLAVNLICVGAK